MRGVVTRRWRSWLLLVLAAVCLLLSVLLIWAKLTFFDSSGFSSQATEAFRKSAVIERLSQRVTEQLVDGRPALEAAGSRIEEAVQSGLERFLRQAPLEAVLAALHQMLLDDGESALFLSLGEAVEDVNLLLPIIDPDLAARTQDLELRIADARDARVRLLRLAHDVELAAYVLPALCIGSLAGAVVVAQERSTVLKHAPLAIEFPGIVLVAGSLIGAKVGGDLASEADATAVRAASLVFLEPLLFAGIALVTIGVVLRLAVVAVNSLSTSPSRIDQA